MIINQIYLLNTQMESRIRYLLAIFAMVMLVTAFVFAPEISTTIITIVNPAAPKANNQTAPNAAPVFPQVSQPAKAVQMQESEMKKPYRPAKTSIKVGIVLSNFETDPMSRAVRSALNQWASEVTVNGGIFLRSEGTKVPVRIIFYDDQDQVNLAKAYHETMALQEKVDLALVLGDPIEASEAVQILEENEVLHIVLSPVQSGSIAPSNNFTILLGGATSSNYGADFGKFAKSTGIRSVAIVRTVDPYHNNVALNIRRSLTDEQIPIVLEDTNSFERGFFVDVVQSIARLRPHAIVVLASSSLEARFVSALSSARVSAPLIFASSATQLPGRLIATLGRDANGLIGYSQWVPNHEFERYSNMGPLKSDLIRVAEANGMFPQAGQVYGSMKIFEKIIEESGSVNVREMNNVAKKLFSGYITQLGPFFVGKDSAQTSNPYVIAQVRVSNEGKMSYEVMWPPEYRTKGILFPFPGWSGRR